MNQPLLRDLYTLTATLDGKTFRKPVRADSDEEAMMDAINQVMAYAYANKEGAWAKGLIELTDPNGLLVNSMDAK